MSAQFKKGDLVWYSDGDKNDKLAAITAVTSDDPAQYHVNVCSTNENTVCGEGKNMPGAVHAL